MSVEIDRETSGMEQTRPWGDVGLMSGLPESGHDWAIYEPPLVAVILTTS